MAQSGCERCRPPRLGRDVWLWVWGVLVSGLVITALAASWMADDARKRDQERFTRLAMAAWEALESRIEADERVLRTLAGYFDDHRTVNTNEWRHRLELIDPAVNHSELSEIGFAAEGHFLWRPLPPQEVMAHALPAPPLGPQQPGTVYFPILYSWRPERWPARAYGEGFFAGSASDLRFTHAYNSAQTAMTPPRTLWQDRRSQSVRGVTLMLATFTTNMVEVGNGTRTRWPDDTGSPPNVRRGNSISGVVFFSWRMDDLFRTVFGQGPQEVALEIFDGKEPVEERRWNTFPPEWLRTRLKMSEK